MRHGDRLRGAVPDSSRAAHAARVYRSKADLTMPVTSVLDGRDALSFAKQDRAFNRPRVSYAASDGRMNLAALLARSGTDRCLSGSLNRFDGGSHDSLFSPRALVTHYDAMKMRGNWHWHVRMLGRYVVE